VNHLLKDIRKNLAELWSWSSGRLYRLYIGMWST